MARGLTIQAPRPDLTPASLAAVGAEPGEAVTLQLPNIPQFLIYFGIKAGCVAVPGACCGTRWSSACRNGLSV